MTDSASSICPRFESCNAPICPLDDWAQSCHLNGEPICLYLREAAKHGGSLLKHAVLANSATHIPEKLAEKVSQDYQAIISRWCDIKRRLSRAALTPSKMRRPKFLKAA